ncbi:MAG: hypothetical protein GY853_15820 [PVC group bacterium]|nr:hypothetical protein [PVC group bacterium]
MKTDGKIYPSQRKKRRRGRVEGDAIYYFAIHNLFSAVFFFAFTLGMDIYTQQTEMLSELLSFSFLELILTIFGLLLLSGIIGRFFAFFFLKAMFGIVIGREMKKFGELNDGLNKISFSFIIASFVSAILFAVGALSIVQSKIFGQMTFWTLVFTYVMIKVVVFVLVRLFSESKL